MTAPAAIVLGALAVCVLVLLGAWQLVQVAAQRARLERRSELEKVEREASRLRYRADARLRRTAPGRWLAGRAIRAGIDLSALELGLLFALAVAVGYLLIAMVAPWWVALLGAYGGWWSVGQWLRHRRDQRLERFVGQLPELARTLSNATSAGRSLTSALQLAARELGDPAATELRRVAEELRLGRPIDVALRALHDRLPSRELAVLVSTLVIQQRAGGDVVAALRDMADTLDARKDLRREVQTLMSGAVSTGYVTGALGIVLLLMLDRMQPGMIDSMASSWGGRAALATAAGLYALAFGLIRRTTDIDL